MNFKKICALFGGSTATARLLRLKSTRHIRRVIADKEPVPEYWIMELKQHAQDIGRKLIEWSEDEL